jgi:hypothetical protein
MKLFPPIGHTEQTQTLPPEESAACPVGASPSGTLNSPQPELTLLPRAAGAPDASSHPCWKLGPWFCRACYHAWSTNPLCCCISHHSPPSLWVTPPTGPFLSPTAKRAAGLSSDRPGTEHAWNLRVSCWERGQARLS